MAVGDAIWSKGTQIVCQTAGSSASISDGSVVECTSDDLQLADVAGKPQAFAEFVSAAGGFSVAPSEGALINIYEQKINSAAQDAPDVSSTYLYDYVGSFNVADTDTLQPLRILIAINESGGKYWLEWLDGGTGTASIDAGWEFRLTPATLTQET